MGRAAASTEDAGLVEPADAGRRSRRSGPVRGSPVCVWGIVHPFPRAGAGDGRFWVGPDPVPLCTLETALARSCRLEAARPRRDVWRRRRVDTIRFSQSGAGLSRRRLLHVGSLGLGAFALPDLLRLRALAGEPGGARDAAVIQVFLGGGPSHIDTFDLKPDAPAEIRGEFRPISTSLAGLTVCEHLPRLAKMMHRFAVVRSVAHCDPGHFRASHWTMTGYRPAESAGRNFNPSCGSVAARLKGANVEGSPAYVGVPRRQIFGGAAYLGRRYDPFTAESEPNAADYRVRNLQLPLDMPADRLRNRRRLLGEMNRVRESLGAGGERDGLDAFTQAAIDMTTNPRVQRAFDVDQEPDAVRDFYGRTNTGQRFLLARRLVEAGATFVTVLSGAE